MKRPTYYPLFADLRGRCCLIVGGGVVAQRKVTTLLRCGARVTVISPTVTKRLAGYAQARKIRYVARRFRPTDLRWAWLIYAATNDQAINLLVSQTAKAKRVFANVVDHTSLCSFIAPAILTRGSLTIAVSTGGASPSLAKKLRDDLKRSVTADYLPMIRLLSALRGLAKRTLPRYQDRKRYFDEVVRGEVCALVQAGRYRVAKQRAIRLLRHRPERNGV